MSLSSDMRFGHCCGHSRLTISTTTRDRPSLMWACSDSRSNVPWKHNSHCALGALAVRWDSQTSMIRTHIRQYNIDLPGSLHMNEDLIGIMCQKLHYCPLVGQSWLRWRWLLYLCAAFYRMVIHNCHHFHERTQRTLGARGSRMTIRFFKCRFLNVIF